MATKISNLISNFIKNDNIIKIYNDGLSVALPIGTVSGMCMGLYQSQNTLYTPKFFTNIIGYTTIGIVTGITYPVSFPVISIYTIISNNK